MLNTFHKKNITTEKEYTNFVREFATLLDEQFRIWENWAKNEEKLHDLARQMPAIISLVNTIGYLRGQDNVFVNIRPRTENQNEFYEYENQFEKRLNKLIDIILHSPEKEYYQGRLKDYLIKTRTRQKPIIW